MPRKVGRGNRGRGSGRRNNSVLGAKITSVAFHSLSTVTLSGATGANSFSLSPQVFTGLSEIADQFDLYRFSQLMYRIHPMDPADTTNQVCCYYPDADIQVQTNTQASESPLAACQTQFCGVPSPWIRVPRSQLKGMLDWYKCTADSGASEFENQGTVQTVGGLSDVTTREFRGICQFKNPVSSTLQLERQIKRLELKGLVVRLPKKPVDTPS